MIDNSDRDNGTKAGLVKQRIRREIDLGNFRRNSLLPSERELAKRLSVSYMTVRRAIGDLVEEQILTRVQGKGTFVRGDIPVHRMQHTLGVIVPAWETPEHADLMMIFTEVAEQNDLHPRFTLCRSWEDRTVTEAYDSCDYLILVPPAPLEEIPAELFERFRFGGKPVVVLGLNGEAFGLDSVTGDFCTAAAIRELRKLGHRRIGLFSQVEFRNGVMFRNTEMFYRNWKEEMAKEFGAEDLEAMELRIQADSYSLPHQALYDYIYVNGGELPFTALILTLSSVWGFLAAAADTRLEIPGKLSLLCIGDRQEARFYRPKLSMIRVSYRRHAELAIEALRRRQLDPEAPVGAFAVPPEFLPGESTASLHLP